MSRRVIIPPGVLDPNKVNIIQVPKILENTNVPLLVTPARKGLRAQALPNWKDELSRIVDEDSQRRHLDARGVKCRRDEAEEARKARNVTFQNKREKISKEIKQLETPISREGSECPTRSRETSQYSRMQRNSLPKEPSGVSQPSYRETSPRPTSPSLFTSNYENQARSFSPYRTKTPTYPSNRPQSPDVPGNEWEEEGEEEAHVEVLCSNKTPTRRVTYVSSLASKQIDDSPTESESIEIDAPEGIGERCLNQIIEQHAREWSQPSPQKTHNHASSPQSSYGPSHSPIGDFNNEYYPEQFCYSDGYYNHYEEQY